MVLEGTRLDKLISLMELYGEEYVEGLLVLILGLLAVRWIMKGFRKVLGYMVKSPVALATAANVLHIILLSIVLIAVAVMAGYRVQPVFDLAMVFFLCVIGLVILFRPYIPSLPFKVGQMVKISGLLGKVEGTTFVNTRIRTFDGKVFFVPNKTILNDVVINYHYTGSRRMKLDIPIQYDQDLMKAKQVLEALMIEDPRVLTSPRPTVWVLDLSDGCIMLGGRCWADIAKYWATRVDLLEKAKLRFDREGIKIAYPHIGIHHHRSEVGGTTRDEETATAADNQQAMASAVRPGPAAESEDYT